MTDSIIDHLKSRHLDLDLHRPIISEEDRTATFYLYNLSGQICGYQQYRPEGSKKVRRNPKEGKYFTCRRQPTLALFGVESLDLTPNVVFLTEGIFDACRMTEVGCSALSPLSNDPARELKNFLRCLNRLVVVVCDNDEAGRKLAKFGDVVITTEEHDLGDSSVEFVLELKNRFRTKTVYNK